MTVRIQISDKRGDAILLVTVEGDTVEQVEADFAAAAGLAGLGAAYEGFGIPNPVAAVPAAAIVTRPAQQDPWGQPPVQPMVPAAATQQYPQAAPAGAPGPAPQCQHGQKLWRTGTSASNGREWKAWFCPAPGNDPTQCKKEWVR
jgi:hypothetical protein